MSDREIALQLTLKAIEAGKINAIKDNSFEALNESYQQEVMKFYKATIAALDE